MRGGHNIKRGFNGMGLILSVICCALILGAAGYAATWALDWVLVDIDRYSKNSN